MILVDGREHLVVIDIDSWDKKTMLTRSDGFDRITMPSWFTEGREIVIVGYVNGTRNL